MKFFLMKNSTASISRVLRIVNLTGIFIMLLVLNVSATGFGQNKVNLNYKNTSLNKVLADIEEQTDFRFLYNENIKGIREKTAISVINAEVMDVLNLLFKNKSLTYTVMQNNLVVIRESEAANMKIFELVTGTVLGEGAMPLSGVSVQVKGTTTGTTTNAEGKFSIDVENTNVTLVFSYVGYETQEVALAGRTSLDITLLPSSLAMDAVVVIGYGTAAKRDLTGSIVTIKGEEIANKPTANPLGLLQGKVAGLSVVNSGRPGAEPDIRIRGTNTINGVKPVYIVDGILNDNINFLNPADIESIEVLKDPSSLAIFGVRGANGAIAITTKKAKAGQMLVNFNTSIGVKKVQDKIQMTDAAQFRELYTEQLMNQGATAFDYALWTANTDWQDEIFQDAIINYNNISITGATEKNRFYLGLGYINEEGIIKHEQYKKYTLNFSDELRVSRGLKFGVTMNAYRAELPQERSVGSAIRAHLLHLF